MTDQYVSNLVLLRAIRQDGDHTRRVIGVVFFTVLLLMGLVLTVLVLARPAHAAEHPAGRSQPVAAEVARGACDVSLGGVTYGSGEPLPAGTGSRAGSDRFSTRDASPVAAATTFTTNGDDDGSEARRAPPTAVLQVRAPATALAGVEPTVLGTGAPGRGDAFERPGRDDGRLAEAAGGEGLRGSRGAAGLTLPWRANARAALSTSGTGEATLGTALAPWLWASVSERFRRFDHDRALLGFEVSHEFGTLMSSRFADSAPWTTTLVGRAWFTAGATFQTPAAVVGETGAGLTVLIERAVWLGLAGGKLHNGEWFAGLDCGFRARFAEHFGLRGSLALRLWCPRGGGMWFYRGQLADGQSADPRAEVAAEFLWDDARWLVAVGAVAEGNQVSAVAALEFRGG